MSQYDFGTIDPDATDGTDLAILLGSWRNALHSTHKGSTAPTYAIAGTPWIDDSGTYWALKRYDGAGWIVEGYYDVTNHYFYPPLGGGAATLGSASTVDLWSVPHSRITVTGNSNITQFSAGNAVPGTTKSVLFTGTPVLTFDSTKMILQSQADIAVLAGDTCDVISLGGNNVAVVPYNRATGKALIVDQQVPTGTIFHGLYSSDPSGYVLMNAGTIGNASSSASLRANADTLALFSVLWALDATVCDVKTSGGIIVARGANAAADFAANRQIVVPDGRAVTIRGVDLSRGVDIGRLLGSYQADGLLSHNHSASSPSTFTGNAIGALSVSVSASLGGRYGSNHYAAASDTPAWSSGDSTWGNGGTTFSGSTSAVGTPSGSVTTTTTIGSTGSTENLVKSIAARTVIKL